MQNTYTETEVGDILEELRKEINKSSYHMTKNELKNWWDSKRRESHVISLYSKESELAHYHLSHQEPIIS